MSKKVIYTGRLPAVLAKADEQVKTKKWDKSRDAARGALAPGKRVSKTRSVYYEKRKNRSDLPGKKI